MDAFNDSQLHLPARSRRSRLALTLIEVMVSLAILGTATAAIMGGLLSLHTWQTVTNEDAVAQRIARLLAERVVGADWDILGKYDTVANTDTSWSWHRREFPRAARTDGTPLTVNPPTAMVDNPDRSPRYPPMTEDAPNPTNNLINNGLLSEKTGIRDLRVYLEYYNDDALNSIGSDLLLRGGNGNAKAVLVYPRRAVTAPAEQGIDRGLPEDADPTRADHLDITRDPISGTPSNAAVLVRVLVAWTSSVGDARQHELILSRKQ